MPCYLRLLLTTVYVKYIHIITIGLERCLLKILKQDCRLIFHSRQFIALIYSALNRREIDVRTLRGRGEGEIDVRTLRGRRGSEIDVRTLRDDEGVKSM